MASAAILLLIASASATTDNTWLVNDSSHAVVGTITYQGELEPAEADVPEPGTTFNWTDQCAELTQAFLQDSTGEGQTLCPSLPCLQAVNFAAAP